MFTVYLLDFITVLFFAQTSICGTRIEKGANVSNTTSTVNTAFNEIQDCEILRGNNNTFTCTLCGTEESNKDDSKLCLISFCSRPGSKNCWTMNSSAVTWDIQRSVYSEAVCHSSRGTMDRTHEVQFDKDYIGVIYSPYDMHQKGWQAYPEDHMQIQMKMISLKFRNISMYGMSTIGYDEGWKEGLIDFPHPKMAADLNLENDKLQISMVVGIYRKLSWKTKHVGLVEEEIQNAANSAILANKLFPGTVWGVSIHMDYGNKAESYLDEEIQDVSNMVEFLKKLLPVNVLNGEKPMSIGIRLWHCSSFKDGLTNGTTKMTALLQKVDFLICSVPPSSNFDFQNTEFAMGSGIAETVFDTIRSVQNLTSQINPDLEIIGESGIPLIKLANLDFATNNKTFQNFWFKMADLSSHYKIRIFLYEAIDEYWKTEISDTEGSGEYYYKSYCGWWARLQNEPNTGQYFEKVTGYLFDTGSAPIPVTSSKMNWSVWAGAGMLLTLAVVGLVWGIVLIIFKKRMIWSVNKKSSVEGNPESGNKHEPVIIAAKYIDMFLEGKCAIDEGDDNNTITVAWRLPYNRKYEISPDQFEIDMDHVLGIGMTGKVYKGLVNQNQTQKDAAFKIVTGESSLSSIKNIMSEIKILSYLAGHPNVVSLLGAFTANIEKGIIYAAIEYCELGSLEDILKFSQPINFRKSLLDNGLQKLNQLVNIPPGYKNPDAPINYKMVEFTLKDLTVWSHDMACGMEYVSKLGVVHADLATRNILITQDRRAKITDFGLSKKLYTEPVVQFEGNCRVPWRYLSPEALRYLTFSTESDVWAFGITLWEIFSLGRIPYLDKEYSLQFIEELEESKLLTCPRYAGEQLCSLMTSCWKINPKERPSFGYLREELGSILEHYADSECCSDK